MTAPVFFIFSALFIGTTLSRKIHIGPCVVELEDSGDCPDPDYIQIFLYTRKNEENAQLISVTETSDNMTATSSVFDPRHPNKLLIHGFGSDSSLHPLQEIKTEYLRQGDVNVWMVNYPRLAPASTVCYPFAVHNIRHVGHCLAQLVLALRRHQSADLHVVGFSLGAHVTNFMANKLSIYGVKLDRITGLDPAGPLFAGSPEHSRLDKGDAGFVDVVHTNGLIQGYLERCGHVDFYMNGGVNQPGCLNESNPFNCDHHRAPEYFAESIHSQEFLGWRCKGYSDYLMGTCKPKPDLVVMGEHCSRSSSGFYIMYTASESPYALGNWTEASYRERAPKTSFTKMSGPEPLVRPQSDFLQRLFPSVVFS